MDNRHADSVWLGGTIATVDPANPRAEALAIKDGRILAVGSDSQIANLAGPGTSRKELGGRFVMPGLVESHVHALWGSCRHLFDVFVGFEASFDQLMHSVIERAKALPVGDFVVGGPWRPVMRGQMGPRPRETLDAISPAHPVVLQDVSHHSLWCNSLALSRAGIGKDTPDIPGGVIERDHRTGEPTGILAETACGNVRALLSRSDAQLAEAARYFIHNFHSFGFTAFKEPMAFETDLKAYKAADERGDLTFHMAAHIVRTSPFSPTPVPYDTIERLRRDYATENIRTDYAKLFLDGVAPSFTASFSEPYLSSAGYDTTSHDPDAILLMRPEDINETVTELDRRGIVIKMHSVGDHAIHVALNAIEAARRANGQSGLRHEVAHCPFVSPTDIPRFATLNAVAEVSPKLWYPNPTTSGQINVLGRERVERSYPIRDLLAAGAQVTYASDWPAAAPDVNPWTGLAGMISRTNTSGDFPGTLGEDQAITLQQALPIFTANGARSLGMEEETGTIQAGKWADLIVLERSPFDMNAHEIGHIEVAETHWKGRQVFGR